MFRLSRWDASGINQILSTHAKTSSAISNTMLPPPNGPNHRNGYRHRDLDTRVATINVVVRKFPQQALFSGWLFERRTRAECALSTVIATCYLKSRMNDLVATLGIAHIPTSHVSRMWEELDEVVADVSNHPLDPGRYPYLPCDTLTVKVNEDARVVTCCVLLATGVNADGYRKILGSMLPPHHSTRHRNASSKT